VAPHRSLYTYVISTGIFVEFSTSLPGEREPENEVLNLLREGRKEAKRREGK